MRRTLAAGLEGVLCRLEARKTGCWRDECECCAWREMWC